MESPYLRGSGITAGLTHGYPGTGYLNGPPMGRASAQDTMGLPLAPNRTKNCMGLKF